MILVGDCLEHLRAMPDNSVHCVVTSPPYWGLRAYGTEPQVWGGLEDCEHDWESFTQPAANGITHDEGMSGETLSGTSATRKPKHSAFCSICGAWKGELGLEPTPKLFIEHLTEIFAEVWRVLRPDGTAWVNMGDSYSAGGRSGHGTRQGAKQGTNRASANGLDNVRATPIGLPPKSLCGMPWRLAFALQDSGWYLRSDIIWAKPNPMPESVRDRPTKAHEYIFLLTKSAKYYYDAEAISEPTKEPTVMKMPDGWDTWPGGHGSFHRNGREKGKTIEVPDTYKGSVPGRQDGPGQERRSSSSRGKNGASGQRTKENLNANWDAKEEANKRNRATEECLASASGRMGREPGWRQNTPDGPTRNARTVWTIATQPFKEAHFAVYPEEIPRRCILAGCPEGGVVLDPFGGSGTTGMVASKLGRDFILIELNPEYAEMARKRIAGVTPGMRFEEAQ